MVARLTKISNTFSSISVLRKCEALFRGLRFYISGNPVVFLCGQIKPCCSLYIILYSLFFRNLALFDSILNCVLVFKLSAVHCCTRATILIQGQLYRYSYRQISVTIHRRIDISNTALLLTQVCVFLMMILVSVLVQCKRECCLLVLQL